MREIEYSITSPHFMSFINLYTGSKDNFLRYHVSITTNNLIRCSVSKMSSFHNILGMCKCVGWSRDIATGNIHENSSLRRAISRKCAKMFSFFEKLCEICGTKFCRPLYCRASNYYNLLVTGLLSGVGCGVP
jgi:hypothetical protein